MLEFFRSAVGVLVPVFVTATMLNVGLTQEPSRIASRLDDRPFIIRMIVANFLAVPLLMVGILEVTSFEPALRAGLLIFSLGAGAPFLIYLTGAAKHDVALGAATMLLLMLLTVPFIPLVLPRLMDGMEVDAWAIARTLLIQLIAPLAVGMIAARFASSIASRVQPWIGRGASIALYAILIATAVGYFPDLRDIIGTGAIAAAMVFILGAFGIGWLAGNGKDHHEDIGALGTAQRNTAAGLIIATQNFDDPQVLVMITIANIAGLLMLLFIARYLSRDNMLRRRSAAP